MSDVEHHRRIDVLAIGLFGLAVGALTLGAAQLGGIPDSNKVGTLVIALIFGGIVQILAGITDIRYHEQLGGTALTMYGFFWLTVSIAKLVSEGTSFHLDMAPLLLILQCVLLDDLSHRLSQRHTCSSMSSPSRFLHRVGGSVSAKPFRGSILWLGMFITLSRV
jgi:hypothetical protein